MWNVIACVLLGGFLYTVFISAFILGKACPQLATEGTACSSYSYQNGSCSVWEKCAHKTDKSNKRSLKCLRSLGRFTEEPKGLSWSRIEPYGSVPRQIKSAGVALCVCVESVLCSRTLLPFLYKGWMEPLFWRATSWEPFSVFNDCWVT